MSPRRKSIDSSDSSGDESSDSKKYKKKEKDKDSKDKKEKKDKDKKDKDKKDKDKDKKEGSKGHKDSEKDHQGFSSGFSPNSQAPMYQGHDQFSSPPFVPPSFEANRATPQFPDTPPIPQAQGGGQPPPSGYRIPLTTTSPFADLNQTGPPPLFDADGVSPVFIGSALFENSVHPCKIGPHLSPFASVAYGGAEHPHHGRYDLLPFVPEMMEFVPTSYGRIPPGRRPIEGGYEENGAKLYHGVAAVNGVRVPGKTGEHLGACNVSFGGSEIAITEHDILCWR